METLALGMAFSENPWFKSPNHFQTSFCLENFYKKITFRFFWKER